MNDVLGTALSDYYHHSSSEKLWIHNKYGRKEEMPVEVYFREWEKMPLLERKALQLCKGRVLDIGAGAGSHSLVLQQNGKEVTALDISAKAVALMKERGITQTMNMDVFALRELRFDTLLLLMNGVGLTGTLQGLKRFLKHVKSILQPGGQLLFDSSDVAYLYKGKTPPKDRYYGEIDFQYEYKKQRTDWFSWLYVDSSTLKQLAREEGWQTEILLEDEFDQYLARLTTA
jgi:SAM-dependent methyltransferase